MQLLPLNSTDSAEAALFPAGLIKTGDAGKAASFSLVLQAELAPDHNGKAAEGYPEEVAVLAAFVAGPSGLAPLSDLTPGRPADGLLAASPDTIRRPETSLPNPGVLAGPAAVKPAATPAGSAAMMPAAPLSIVAGAGEGPAFGTDAAAIGPSTTPMMADLQRPAEASRLLTRLDSQTASRPAPNFAAAIDNLPAGVADPGEQGLLQSKNDYARFLAGLIKPAPAGPVYQLGEALPGRLATARLQPAPTGRPTSVAMEAQLTKFLGGRTKPADLHISLPAANYRLPLSAAGEDVGGKNGPAAGALAENVAAAEVGPVLFRETAPEVLLEKADQAGDNFASGVERLAKPLSATANPNAAVINLASGRSVSENRVVDQVIEWMSISSRHGNKSLTVRLHPEELGQLKLEMMMDKDGLKAQLHTQTQQVLEVIEQHLPRIREALEQLGLKLGEIHVNVEAGPDDGKAFSHGRRSQDQPAGLAEQAPGNEVVEMAANQDIGIKRTGQEGLSLRV